jgi:bifunctional enzyme CysN/CysC
MQDSERAAAIEVEEWLRRHENKSLLRFITCGSVDDGKSSLIGRLIYDCKLVYEDQLASLAAASDRFGTTGAGQLDLALLVDGLAAEREQGITIDVAYRFFATDHRKFIVADTPGHEQYTRNMATGASTADAAVLLVDARKGVLPQTMRHSVIVSLMGIRHIILAVNKMDLVSWDQAIFRKIERDYRSAADKLGIRDVLCVPLSALTGDNVTRPKAGLDWYHGPTLLDGLEAIDVAGVEAEGALRFPVQLALRAGPDFRGFAGTVADGTIRPGDPVTVLPSGYSSKVARIVTGDGDLDEAVTGRAVILVLEDEIDISRGNLIVGAQDRPEVAGQFAVHIVWMSKQHLLPGRTYIIRIGSDSVSGQITEIKHKLDPETLHHLAAKHLELNDIAVCNLVLDRPVPFDRYVDNRTTGGFILIDRISNATVGCGMIDFALRRASNLHWQVTKVDKSARSTANHQKPCVLWFTGLSGAGKSTIADCVEQRLHALGKRTMLLDGDNVRHGLNKDLGFTEEDRIENIRRIAEVAKLMVEAGLIILVSIISPFRNERNMARELFDPREFLEVYVDTPLSVCESRDPKGLYRKARAGHLPNFTGIDSPYEPPESPDVHLAGDTASIEDMVQQVIVTLEQQNIIW